jgi:hypothetical protein
MTRAQLSSLPFWPRYLSRDEAARYVGVSSETFDGEVAQGLWPPPRRRGGKGGRLTWDRALLDATADRDSGLAGADVAIVAPAVIGVWGERSNGETKRKRPEGRPQKAS